MMPEQFSRLEVIAREHSQDADPICRERPTGDKQWTLDHFYRKLLRLSDTLHTETACALAAERVALLQAFLDQFAREIG